MRILALETSTHTGSVAAAVGGTLLAERNLEANQRNAQSLVPGIGALVSAVGWRMPDIDLVAVTIGPGSFTGLRVGVATAKTLAYALQARVVGINTLEAIAAQAVCEQPRLSVAIDAGRGEVFAGAFERQAVANVAPSSDTFDGPRSGSHEPTILTRWHMVGEPGITAIEEWLSEISSDTALSGPALDRLLPRLPPGTAVVESSQWLPRAATVAALAWQWHLMGRYDDVWKLAPLYLRRSAAEEKWEARHGARG